METVWHNTSYKARSISGSDTEISQAESHNKNDFQAILGTPFVSESERLFGRNYPLAFTADIYTQIGVNYPTNRERHSGESCDASGCRYFFTEWAINVPDTPEHRKTLGAVPVQRKRHGVKPCLLWGTSRTILGLCGGQCLEPISKLSKLRVNLGEFLFLA